MLAAQLGWYARAVVVDNPTSYYVTLPDASRSVPPGVFGCVVGLDGTQVANAALVLPPQQVPLGALPLASGFASLTFYDEALPPNPGHLITQAIGRQRLYPEGVVPATTFAPSFVVNNSTFNGFFTLPPGTTHLRLLANASGLTFTYTLMVLGVVTGEQYFGSEAAPGTAFSVGDPTLPFTLPLDAEWDPRIQVQAFSAQSVKFSLSALFVPEAPGQAGSAQSVVQPLPAAWQAPNSQPSTINNNVAAGGNATIIPAAVGLIVRLFGVWVSTSALGLSLQTDPGGQELGTVGAINVPYAVFYAGAPLPVGQGLRIHNGGGATISANGTVSFSYSLV